jgi:hypothetical protein
MPWLYDTKTGEVAFQNSAEADLQEASNLFGPITGQGEVVNLGIPNTDTQAQAITAAQKYAAAHPGSTAPTANSTTTAGAQDGGNEVSTAVDTADSDAAGISQLTGYLVEGATWMRLAKIVIGGALVLIGVAHMTGASGVIAETARKVPLPI